jgi:PmbA/TldA metallopeptidase C-terminal domain
MMPRRAAWRTVPVVAAVLVLPAPALTQTSSDPVGRAMRDELARSMAQLRLDTLPRPYFVAYRVDEIERVAVAASLGSLLRTTGARDRHLEVELRVGDYAFDNTNFLSFPGAGFSTLRGFSTDGELPLDDNYQESRRQIWLATDEAYKAAVEELSQKRGALQNRAPSEHVPDFARESVATITDLPPTPQVTRAEAESLVRVVSAVFREMPDVYTSEVEWTVSVRRTRYVNSEGSSFERTSPWVAFSIRATTQASDGMPLNDFLTVSAGAPQDLPSRDALADSARQLGARLIALRRAPGADVYHGPVLFEGQASAELFDRVFARRLVATRRPDSNNPMFGQFARQFYNPFLDELGGRVLPLFLNVTNDPTLTVYQGHFLGGYRVDDDGVPARATKLVERGVLKTLLTTRVPVQGIQHSTGNRWGWGATAGTLLVTVDSGLSETELRRRLLELAKARGNPYGIIVRRLASLLPRALDDPMVLMRTMTDEMSGTPTLTATLAFKLYPDGREELIRNAEIPGITAATLKDIVAASASATVYTAGPSGLLAGAFTEAAARPFAGVQDLTGLGINRARSYVVPSLLFDDLSLQRPREAIPSLPLLTPPSVARP